MTCQLVGFWRNRSTQPFVPIHLSCENLRFANTRRMQPIHTYSTDKKDFLTDVPLKNTPSTPNHPA